MTIFPRLNRTLLIATSALALAAAAPAGASSLSVIYQPTDEPGPVTLLPPVPVKTGVISGTPQGGQGSGDLFLLTQNKKSQTYTRTTIYTFANANAPVDGSAPSPNLVADKKGNIWGTTQGNGANGNGTLYELVAPATRKGAYTFRLVMQMPAQFTHEFAGDGFDQLAFDTKGNLFGLIRGDLNGTGLGGIFEVTKAQLASGNGAPALLYTFPSSDDSLPYGLAIDQHGNMFGVEPRGGSVPIDDYYAGALWEVSPPAKKGGAYTRQNIYNFCSIVNSNNDCVDGWLPMGGVSIGPNGAVYGTTFYEGVDPNGNVANGTIWSAQPPSGGSGPWTFTTLHTLYNYNADGSNSSDYYVMFPINRPLLLPSGQLVITPTYGGAFDEPNDLAVVQGGVLGVNTSTGDDGMINNAFAAYNVQAGPVTNTTGISMDKAGNLYGVTSAYYAPNGCSGACTDGTIFKVTP